MTGTPPPPPPESAGDAPDNGDDERYAARPGQHESHTPQSSETSAGHGRHEMAGSAGYPQFEGPGAAQYGSEPVEPPPPLTAQPGHGPAQQESGSGAPQQQTGYESQTANPSPGYSPTDPEPGHGPGRQAGGSAQSGYGPAGTSQPQPQSGYSPTGTAAQEPSGAAQAGYGAAGSAQQQSPQPGYSPAGQQPPPGYGPTGTPAPEPVYGPPGTPQQQPPQPSYGPSGTGPGGPPPGAYGYPQPPVAQQGAVPGDQPVYGYQQAGTAGPATLDVGQALSYGWERFRSNPGPWLAVTACGLIIYLAFVIVVRVTNPTTMFPLLLIFLAVLAGVWLLQAAMIRGALYETDGTKPPFGAFFRFVNAGNVLLTALLAFVATCLASAACLLPGLVVGILCMFSLHFVVDQDQGPFEAIKSSAMLVIANIWPVLLLALAVILITFVGTLLCGLGLLVAGPVAVMAVTYAYRTLSTGVVAPL